MVSRRTIWWIYELMPGTGYNVITHTDKEENVVEQADTARKKLEDAGPEPPNHYYCQKMAETRCGNLEGEHTRTLSFGPILLIKDGQLKPIRTGGAI